MRRTVIAAELIVSHTNRVFRQDVIWVFITVHASMTMQSLIQYETQHKHTQKITFYNTNNDAYICLGKLNNVL